jgi:membrane protease YdiL (CAAX protease family)
MNHLTTPSRVRSLITPAGEVLLFLVSFVVLSLICVMPVAMLAHTRVVGIWFILPFTLVFVTAYQRVVHHQGLSSLGVVRGEPFVRTIALGFVAAGVVTSGINGVHYIVGWIDLSPPTITGLPVQLAAAGVGLGVIVNIGIGLGEELIFRGYVLTRLQRGYRRLPVAVVSSAVIYSLIHAFKGVGVLVLINLFLLGIVLALAVILTRSLWLSIGLHAGWDFWGDGIYFYRVAAFEASRVFTFDYHLGSQFELVIFKFVTAIFLLLMAAGLLVLARRRGTWAATVREAA